MRKLRAYRRLRRLKAQTPPWELWVLLLLLVTVLGIAARRPSQSLTAYSPKVSATNSRIQQDPYDIQPESSELERRNVLETGL